MSAAIDLASIAYFPAPTRDNGDPVARVHVLHPPAERSIAAPLRLTRRGVVAGAIVLACLAIGLVWAARASAPGARVGVQTPSTVSVHAGDSLWSIASRIAPQRDPRAEVADLVRINHLADAQVAVGQVLLTR